MTTTWQQEPGDLSLTDAGTLQVTAARDYGRVPEGMLLSCVKRSKTGAQGGVRYGALWDTKLDTRLLWRSRLAQGTA